MTHSILKTSLLVLIFCSAYSAFPAANYCAANKNTSAPASVPVPVSIPAPEPIPAASIPAPEPIPTSVSVPITAPEPISTSVSVPIPAPEPIPESVPQVPVPSLYSDIYAYLKAGVAKIDFPNTGNFQNDALEIHNLLRKLMGRQELQWDSVLANQAQTYAQHLGQKNIFEHSNKTLEPYGFLGENMHKNDEISPLTAILFWFNEYSLYPQGTKIGDGDFHGYAHFTQLSFPSVTRVGCGHYIIESMVYLVCNYDVCQYFGDTIDMSIPSPKPFGL